MKAKRRANEVLIIVYVLIFIVGFGFFGWAMAEQDNQMLREELVSLKYKVGSDE
ncbi:hypothetical protein J7S89_00395 [Acinetobacter baumannii]|uniref:hypothetical protein n=1 Tax=Acinetobacter TaxID=469 RepID=UPI00028EDBC3|nr:MULTISPECIES: hypothetical protein [Acinetobacter]EMT95924.1 hypothetical protein ABNIH6_09612 [Acinetobacter baumannii ABNIH6]EMU13354.1 hypothetical protein ABNIH10_05962 [Acinetobacter baumannii ABNIH10]EHU1266022.1 hypothetical protein [Acinetobacter baumannii]EHU1294471.1 hypothetical protein [Acinetobacter baumannii]EHU1350769.1 hypothetical protein [Acinetobacter baumannii]